MRMVHGLVIEIFWRWAYDVEETRAHREALLNRAARRMFHRVVAIVTTEGVQPT